VAGGTNAVISDFTDMKATVVTNDGRQGTWVTTPGGTTIVEAGVLHVSTSSGSWASSGTVIANTMCYDASRYMGISFKVRSPTNTSLLFIVQTPDTAMDFSHMRAPITVTPTLATVQVPFASLVKPTFGAGSMLPAGYQAQSKMTGIAFGVATEMEKLDLFVDDVTFY
jgi:hypothetical protein